MEGAFPPDRSRQRCCRGNLLRHSGSHSAIVTNQVTVVAKVTYYVTVVGMTKITSQ